MLEIEVTTLLTEDEVRTSLGQIYIKIGILSKLRQEIEKELDELHDAIDEVRRRCPHPEESISTRRYPGFPTHDVCNLCGQNFD